MQSASKHAPRFLPWGVAVALPLVVALGGRATADSASEARSDLPPDPATVHAISTPRILSLPLVLDLVTSHNPGLAGAAWRVRAAEGREMDARRRPNPVLEAGAENWGGSLGSGRTESSLGLSQLIELGGDRAARSDLARAEVEQARTEAARDLRDLLAAATDAYIEAWAAHERARHLGESRRIAEDAVAAALERQKAGAASPVERIRAEGTLALIEAELARAEAQSASALRVLALQWGASDAVVDSLTLPEPDLGPPPPADSILARLVEHPDLRQATGEERIARARARLAGAGRVPDLEARGGVRHLREADGTGFAAGLALALPIWSTQAGSVVTAHADRSRAGIGVTITRRRLESELRSALDRLGASIAAYDRLRGRAAPAAAEALATLRSAYRAGRLSYVDLAEGQRTLLDTRLAMIEATAEVWRSRAALDRLIGTPAETQQGVDR